MTVGVRLNASSGRKNIPRWCLVIVFAAIFDNIGDSDFLLKKPDLNHKKPIKIPVFFATPTPSVYRRSHLSPSLNNWFDFKSKSRLRVVGLYGSRYGI